MKTCKGLSGLLACFRGHLSLGWPEVSALIGGEGKCPVSAKMSSPRFQPCAEVKWLRNRLVGVDFDQNTVIVGPLLDDYCRSMNRHYDLGDGRHGHFSASTNRDGSVISVLGIKPADGKPIFPDQEDHVNVLMMLESREFRHGASAEELIRYLSYDKRNEKVVLAWIDWIKKEVMIASRAGKEKPSHMVQKEELMLRRN